MDGQYSIFDYGNQKHRPCDYRFKRYIGQKVGLSVASGEFVGEVIEIEPYYTTINIKGHGLFAGTPTTIYPIERSDYD